MTVRARSLFVLERMVAGAECWRAEGTVHALITPRHRLLHRLTVPMSGRGYSSQGPRYDRRPACDTLQVDNERKSGTRAKVLKY